MEVNFEKRVKKRAEETKILKRKFCFSKFGKNERNVEMVKSVTSLSLTPEEMLKKVDLIDQVCQFLTKEEIQLVRWQ
jgi:hypothetical protein